MKYITHKAIIKCPHGGIVSLDHVTDCGILIHNNYPVLKQHILGATISGCSFTNNPCVLVSNVPPASYAPNQKFNNDLILVDTMSEIALTNTSNPLTVSDPGY